MRLSLFFFFVCAFNMLANHSNAQNAIIQIEANTLTVGQLIREIEEQTDYLVVFRNKEVDTDKQVSIRNKRGEVASYLNAAFTNT
ncbi:hypothetical protein LJC38_07805, partial [Parabacteroides sp. OttesenSCG-928-K15]|nr:hypothetical protein [Parabacteroides sp. OttesenSCG-928-K15]